MTSTALSLVTWLSCHPSALNRWVRSIEVQVQTTPEGALALLYRLTGDVTHLDIPAARPPMRTDGLWQHTCFEAFVRTGKDAAYHEFNFAPSGEWAAYRFDSYRNGTMLEEATDPCIVVRRDADRLELDARIAGESLPAGASLSLALCAVIEDREANVSHWALRHPPGKPDFHHPDGFALELDSPFAHKPVNVERQ